MNLKLLTLCLSISTMCYCQAMDFDHENEDSMTNILCNDFDSIGISKSFTSNSYDPIFNYYDYMFTMQGKYVDYYGGILNGQNENKKTFKLETSYGSLPVNNFSGNYRNFFSVSSLTKTFENNNNEFDFGLGLTIQNAAFKFSKTQHISPNLNVGYTRNFGNNNWFVTPNAYLNINYSFFKFKGEIDSYAEDLIPIINNSSINLFNTNLGGKATFNITETIQPYIGLQISNFILFGYEDYINNSPYASPQTAPSIQQNITRTYTAFSGVLGVKATL